MSDSARDDGTGIDTDKRQRWMSDLVVDWLVELGYEWVALNPGGSYRGLHDSIVNDPNGRRLKMLLCIHEDHAISIAHGFAKATGLPMASIVHTNVGLMHASMGIYNAWCDRAPMLILGSNGPADAAQRRPWIDWIHSSADMGAIVRDFVKWDNEPRSVAAAEEAILRADSTTRRAPTGPVYVVLDSTLQESPIDIQSHADSAGRVHSSYNPGPSRDGLDSVVAKIRESERPVLLYGRCGHDEEEWRLRLELAEALGAAVVTDLKVGAAFPTDHALHVGSPANTLDAHALGAISESDCIIAFDWLDLSGSIGKAPVSPNAAVFHFSMDEFSHRGWSYDHQSYSPRIVNIRSDAFAGLKELSVMLGIVSDDRTANRSKADSWREARTPGDADYYIGQERSTLKPRTESESRVSMRALAGELSWLSDHFPTTIARLPIGWPAGTLVFRSRASYLGGDGGAGLGSGPGLVIGAALGSAGLNDRVVVGVLGDGDFLMGATALWTGVANGIGAVIIVANNESNFNDELHQAHVARTRGRPVENAGVGQRFENPALDICGIAASQGARAFGPIYDAADLRDVISEAYESARQGSVCVVDVRVVREYDQTSMLMDSED